MGDKRKSRTILLLAAVMAATGAFAFQPIPKESAKALGVTRGKSFSAGAVFIDGKFLPPPYVVERWGTGIRINSRPVTGQVIDWNEFLKTQSGVKVTKTEIAAPQPVAAPAPAPAPAPVVETEDSSLDDLFDDDPKPKKKAPVAAAPRPVAAPPKPKTVVSYSFDGDFAPNDATKAMVVRINAVRTEIDRLLRAGGFICFGSSYSRVTGDARTLDRLLDALPDIQQHAESEQGFLSAVRSAKLVYLNEILCAELFRNRIDYRKLKEFRVRRQKEAELQKVLDGVSTPLF